jgi:hypothetical protein
MFGSGAVPSAVLTEERLIGLWGDNTFVLKGLDRQTGAVVWEATDKLGGHTSMQRMLVPIGATGKHVEIMYYGTGGKVFRAGDGKLLLDSVANHQTGRPQGISGNILVIANGACDGGNGRPVTYPKGLVAVRITAESEDSAKAQLLWSREDIGGYALPTIHDGVVYVQKDGIQVLDLMTGKTLAKVVLPRGTSVNHMFSVAGGHLFGFEGDGSCVITTLGKDAKLVGVNRLGRGKGHGWFNQGSQPFFSGNRMFVRSYTDVYCIGDPKEPLRLSKAHQ